MRYEDLIHDIIASYSNSDCIDMASNNKTIPKCLVQYEETDWQFIKRLASHFGAVLIPDATMEGPKFFYGIPIGRNGEIYNDIYDYRKDLNEYRYALANGEDISSIDDFLVYKVESGKVFNMGDNITFRGDLWKVSAVEAHMDGGLLKFRYELSKEPSIRQNFIYNDKIIGASLQGKILDVAKDTVKVHLEVDKQQSAGEASWFSYASLYTAEGNSGFYCMPEKGDSVMLYFPDGEEKNATAMSSVRKGGGSSPKHADPSVKYWGGPNGKELKMTPSEVSLTAQAGSIFIRMTDDGGIVVKSDKPLTITSKKNMSLDATKKLVISAQEGIEMTCDTSSIILDGQTDIQASVIKMEGIKKNPVTVAQMPELDAAEVQIEEAPKPEKKSFWGGLLDGVQLALDVVGMIPVVGEVADLANGAISLGRGDYVGAALSFAAACPIGGQVATGAKWARKIGKAAKGSKAGQAVIRAGVKVVKAGDRLKNVIDKSDVLKNVRRVWSQLGGVLTSARNLLSNLSMSQMLAKLTKAMDGVKDFAAGFMKVSDKMMGVMDAVVTVADASIHFLGSPGILDTLAVNPEMAMASMIFGVFPGKKKNGARRKPKPKPDSKASAQVLDLKNVDNAAKEYASNLRRGIIDGVIKKTTGGKIDAKVLTVAVDKKTGEMFYGISGYKNNPTRLNETHKDLKRILNHKKDSETNYPLDNCGEFNAINHALINGNKVTDLKLYTINIKSGEFKEMCLNCNAMYSKLVTIIK
ncbi:hypothetical protein FPZ44_02630 [Paenibacillus agilis]|uniref:Gp5/Type VI secretion system Vgr protein OB-fold domain-containing protein n=2 Tax=Paenibacillus agilis TaxID=3020863 RepID=A0A559IWN6_9BACL|nr:hypothetical protein FPZ44_02630 [Paenibacillus agilis]